MFFGSSSSTADMFPINDTINVKIDLGGVKEEAFFA